jgi:hypothetical protein
VSDNLILAARHALHVWDNEDNMEKNDLSDEFFDAMGELRKAVMVINEVVPSE